MALRTSHPCPYAAVLVVATLAACNDPSSVDSPYIVTPVTTTALAGTPGWTLTDTLVVEVRDFDGNLVPGARVTWSLPNGGRLAVQLADADDPMQGTADSHGRNYAVWTLGLDEGTQVARAVSGLTGVPVEFEAASTVLHALQVSVGGGYACAVLTDRRPACWGMNDFGQLGTGDTAYRATPTPVTGLPAVREIQGSASGPTCARDLGGDIWCWGRNLSGGAGPAATQPRQLLPVRVAGAEGAVSLSVANSWLGFACAVLGSGGAKCWGDNRVGQLGTGDLVSSATPRAVVGSADFRSVSSGGERSCALDSDGEAWCWGDARGNEMAPLPPLTYTTPMQPVPGHRYTSLAAGGVAVCGIQLGGVVSCFGDDFVSFGHLPISDLQPGDAPVRPDLTEPIAQLAVDDFNGTYARTRHGLGYVWGEPGCCDFFTALPVMMTPSLRIVDIAAGGNDYCVISEEGGLYCGPVNWWSSYLNERERLRGVPAEPAP
jgi:hypothetical protein